MSARWTAVPTALTGAWMPDPAGGFSALLAPGFADALTTLQEALEPLPAEPPIGGPFWTVLVPALLLAGTTLATWLLYRRFSGED